MLLDIHGHPPHDRADLPSFLAALERFDSCVLISDLGARQRGWVHLPDVPHWQEGNAQCAELVRQHPNRLLGYCYVSPEHGREALAEMEQRLLGEPDVFAALKLWVAVRAADPRLDPLMEFCAAHDVPVLQHTWIKTGPAGPGSGNLPGESTPEDLAALARRHPRVRFFGGHTGGDWEWGVAAFAPLDNIWLDIAGGEATNGYVQLALRRVGAGRIVFGTDVPGRSIPAQLAKLLALNLPPADLERVLWRNAVDVLGARLPPAWQAHFRVGPAAARSAGGGRPPAAVGRGTDSRTTGAASSSGMIVAAHDRHTSQENASNATYGSIGGGVARRQPPNRDDQAWSSRRLPSLPRPEHGGYFDAGSFLGEWPARRLNGWPAPNGATLVAQRLALMDRLEIRRAAVSRLEAVWLKDSGQANAELHDLVAGQPDRFLPVYTLNPLFPAWPEHLARCIEEYGLAPGRGAIRLLPAYHGYQPDAPALDAAVARLAAAGIPIVLTVQLDDPRMQHPRMHTPDLPPAAVAALVSRWPAARWIVAGATHAQILAIAREAPLPAQVWFDLSRVQGPIDCVRSLCTQPGPHRLLFGTNLPLLLAEAPILELADACLPAADDAAIRYRNAFEAFQLAHDSAGPQ